MHKYHARPSNQYRYEHYDPWPEWEPVFVHVGEPDSPTPATEDSPADAEPADAADEQPR